MASIAIMRNRVTGEFKKVVGDSQEFYDLRATLHADGRPRWEQTGEHDYDATQRRLAGGRVRPEDIGDELQPVASSTGVVSEEYQVGLDRGWPTPGEIEQRAGRAGEMSEDELAALTPGAGGDAGYPAGNPPTTEGDDGGSNVSTVPTQEKLNELARQQAEGASSSDGSSDDYEKRTVPQLKDLAESRGLEVPSDAKKADLVDLLKEDDSSEEEGED